MHSSSNGILLKHLSSPEKPDSNKVVKKEVTNFLQTRNQPVVFMNNSMNFERQTLGNISSKHPEDQLS